MNFETFMKKYKEWQEQPHMFIINNKRMKEIDVAYGILKEIIEDYSPDAKFDFKINQFNNRNVKVTGTVTQYKNELELSLEDSNSIKFE